MSDDRSFSVSDANSTTLVMVLSPSAARHLLICSSSVKHLDDGRIAIVDPLSVLPVLYWEGI